MFSSLNLVSAVKNPLSKIKASLKQLVAKQKIQSTQVIPSKLYHISTPTEANIQSLLEELKTANQFQLWNISEYAYQENILSKVLEGRQRNSDGRQIIYNLTYQYFASIPFCEMIKSIETIEAFLSLNPKNKVYVHCQQNKRRSAIFLASYIFLTGQQTDIVSSIIKVNKLLKISMQEKEASQNSPSSIYKSQHILLKNLMNYTNNSGFINKNAWNLKKILINNAPKIQDVLRSSVSSFNPQNQIKFKVLLQIRSVQGISYKKVFQDQFIQGESLCLRIQQQENVLLKDDFVVIIKYVYDKKGYSILRVQLNTNFIYDQYCRIQRNDMDLSVFNAHSKNDTIFMDLLLQNNPKEQSQLSKLNILKESGQEEKYTEMVKQKNSKLTLNSQSVQQDENQEEDEEDGFGILDQEQEAVHNQKMQREIEEQLARELEKIRKKKTQEQELPLKSQNTLNQKEEIKKSIPEQILKRQELIKSKQKDQQKDENNVPNSREEEKKNPVQEQKINQNKQQEINSVQKIEQNDDKEQNQKPKSQQQSSSQQDESSSSSQSQQQEQQEDLDDYLSKLEKQAENHS